MMELAIFAVALLSGATAAVVGFGIGSLLTPVLAATAGMSGAIAAVAIPHAVATGIRAWRLRRHVDWAIIRSFGVLSGVGGLAGAALYSRLGGRSLTLTLGALLLLTASAGLTGWSTRWRPPEPLVPVLGFISGFFGGLAGNQGGLRAAAMQPFRLAPAAFVATSTVIGVLVDAARTPIYLWQAGATLIPLAPLIGLATAGVVIGTFLGDRFLRTMSPAAFTRVITVAIAGLGAWLLVSAW